MCAGMKGDIEELKRSLELVILLSTDYPSFRLRL